MMILKIVSKLNNKINCEIRRIKICQYCIKKPHDIKILGKIFCFQPILEIGTNVTLYPGVTFMGDGLITIGNNCKIGNNVVIYANKNGGIFIGNNTIIAANSYIIDSNHGIKNGNLIQNQKMESEKLLIGSDVWIGANAAIIKGAKLEDGVVVGANSLINKDIPKNAVCVGSPARIIKYR